MVEFAHPSLGWMLCQWVEAHCVIPDGFNVGKPFVPWEWQARWYLNHYRVRPEARWRPEKPMLASAFHFRRSQVRRPQKAGKNPLIASACCAEGVAPVLFRDWANGGEVYDCAEHGCRCGWGYEYELGEPMGMAWPTPLIQITAVSEEATGNTYDALRPMIDDGPLHALIPKTGEEFIRLPNRGRIDTVTSSARSRLGQRVTFCPQDETGLWTVQAKMVDVAETQRRGLAGMGGRAAETTNGYDPTENSVAQRTAEAAEKTGDIYIDAPEAPAGLSYTNRRERARIHRVVYAGSESADLDDIEREAVELIAAGDAAQAERFFGNRIVAGQGHAFDPEKWATLADASVVVADRSLVVVGVDGARFDDALAIVGTEVESGHQWLIHLAERPPDAPDDYEHDFDAADEAMLDVFDRLQVWRVYPDPQWIDGLVDRWTGRCGDKVIVPWFTWRKKQIGWAVRNYVTAVNTGELSHDGDSDFARHIGNARRRPLGIRDDEGRPLYTLAKESADSPLKMDAAMAAVLSWEARGDAIAANARPKKYRAAGF